MTAGARATVAGRLLWFAALAIALLHVAYNRLGSGSDALAWIAGSWTPFAVIVICSGCALLRGVAVRRERAAWWTFAAGLAVYAAGQASWIVLLGNAPSETFPGVADVLWLTLVPFTLATITLLVRAHGGPVRKELWLDAVLGGLTVAAAAVLVIFEVVIDPVVAVEGAPANLAFALGDALVVGFGVGACAIMGWRPPRSIVVLVGGFFVLGLQDTTYLDSIISGTWAPGTLLDSTWLVAMVAIAIAPAWTPAGAPRPTSIAFRRETVFLTAFAAVAVSIVGYAGMSGEPQRIAVGLAIGALLAAVGRSTATLLAHARVLAAVGRQAVTDELTGLPNRRALVYDGARAAEALRQGRSATLVLCDLDGFKTYNDTYGHPAGDALLVRLAGNLAEAVAPWGRAYRLGGDEFCALLWCDDDPSRAAAVAAVAGALTEEGEAFAVRASYGSVLLPAEAVGLDDALRLADERLYIAKSRLSGLRRGVPTELAFDHDGGDAWLDEELRPVARLAAAVARRMGVAEHELHHVVRAAELHDIGNMAIPESILNKPGPLTEQEWRYVRRHTLIAERLVSRLPELEPVSRLLRACHERFDGRGYPDGTAGDEIPLGARIIFACEAFHAMTIDRPYRRGLAADRAVVELGRHAGTQFDPAVVRAVVAEVRSGRWQDAHAPLAQLVGP